MQSRIYITSPEQRNGIIWVNRIGIRNEIAPAIIDRINCQDFFMIFSYTDLLIRDSSGLKMHPAGSLICWKPLESHYYGNEEKPCCGNWIHFDGPNAKILTDHFSTNTVIPVKNPSTVNIAFQSIYKELSTNYFPDAVILNSIFEILFRTIQREINKSNCDKLSPKNIPEKLIEIKDYLNNHYFENIQIKELLKHFYVSESYLYKNFKNYFNCSPIEYLINIRMEQVKYFLQDKNLKLNEVAQKTGYSDIYHFSKAIKRNFGISPIELRKKILTEKPKKILRLYYFIINGILK